MMNPPEENGPPRPRARACIRTGPAPRRRGRRRRSGRSTRSRRPSATSRTTRPPRRPAWGCQTAARTPGSPRPGPRTAPARHRHDPGDDAVGGQQPGGAQADGHLAAGADQHEVRILGAFLQHVGTPGEVGGAVPRALQDGHRLAREDQRGRTLVAVDDEPPRVGDLVGIRRPYDSQTGHGPAGGQLLDRLVGRAVLAQADRVVGPAVDDLGLAHSPRPTATTPSTSSAVPSRSRRSWERPGMPAASAAACASSASDAASSPPNPRRAVGRR